MLLCADPFTVTAADAEARAITGVAVTYGIPGNTSAGPVVFAPGSLTRTLASRASKVRLVLEHDRTRPVGRLVAHHDTADTLTATFQVARTPAGDTALVEASEGVRDGLSVGVSVITSKPQRGGVLYVTEAALTEVSLVAFPAFDEARVSDVAASDPGHDPRLFSLRIRLTKD